MSEKEADEGRHANKISFDVVHANHPFRPSISQFGSCRQFPAQFIYGDYRLGSIGDLQCFENYGDMIFHRRLGQLEHLTDRFVIFALHHERKHIELTIGQAEIRW